MERGLGTREENFIWREDYMERRLHRKGEGIYIEGTYTERRLHGKEISQRGEKRHTHRGKAKTYTYTKFHKNVYRDVQVHEKLID